MSMQETKFMVTGYDVVEDEKLPLILNKEK